MTVLRPHACHQCSSCESRLEGIFASLDGEALDRLNRSKVSHTYRRGQALYYEGTPVLALFCIRSGIVKVHKRVPRDRRHILYLAEAGDVLGMESLLSGEVHSATAEMQEDGVVCQVDRAELGRILAARPDLVHAVAKTLADQLRRSEERQTDLAASDVRERLAKTLLVLATHFGNGAEPRSIGVRLSREELADIIGASTETTIRQLMQFRQHGLVALEGRDIVIQDVDRLARLAHFPTNGF